MADKKISELTNYTPPIDADVVPIVDSATGTTKKLTWANLKATIKTYYDSLTATLTNKTIDADNNTITNIGDEELKTGINANKISSGSVSNTEFDYINGVTSAIQTQLDNKEPKKGSDDNYVTDAEKTVIGNTSGINTGDMSDSDVKTAYENNADTNAYTDAEKAVVGNTSGVNTGDQDLSGLALKSNVLELDNTAPFTPDADYKPATKKYVDDNAGGTPEGTAVKSTGEAGATKFLREDGDGTCSWQDIPGGGDMLKSTYDTNANGKVDTSDALIAHEADTDNPHGVIASQADTDTTNFNNNLSSTDTDIQKALETLDNLSIPSTTADLPDSTDKRYITDAEKTVLDNTSGTNTGDQDLSSYATKTGTETLTNKTLTSPVINTPSGMVKGDVGLGNVDNTSDATKNNTTATLTNKRITPRVGTVASASTITPTGDSSDLYTVTALAVDATIASPSGTPTNGQKLMIRIKDDGTSRTLTWNAIYNVVGVTLPTATTAGKTHYIGCIYNSANSKWDILAVGEEA